LISHKYITLFVLGYCLILLYTTYFNSIFAELPSFNRQEVEDENNDLRGSTGGAYKNLSSECINGNADFLDITSLSYISDGKKLNATLWLAKPFDSAFQTKFFNFELKLIMQQKNNKSKTLNNDLDKLISFIRNNSTYFDLIERSNITIENEPATKIIFRMVDTNHTLKKGFLINTVKNDNQFFIYYLDNYKHYLQHLPLFEKLFSSIKFIEFNSSSFLTYENPEYGIRLNYPINWEIKEYLDLNSTLSSNNKQFIFLNRTYFPEFTTINHINQLMDRISLYDFTITDYKSESNNTKIGNNSYKTIISNITVVNEVSHKFFNVIIYSIIKDDWIYDIVYMTTPHQYSQHLPLFEKLFSSIKFIEFNSSSFLTYENPEYGIRLNYPINWILTNNDNHYYNNFKNQKLVNWEHNEKKESLWRYVEYSMSIDVDSKYESHKSLDYYEDIIWNFSQKQWNNIIGEYHKLGDRKILQNISESFKEEGIDFSFDLGIANYPKQYKLFFYAHARNLNGCYFIDSVNFVAVPPPEFTISTLNKTTDLRQGEKIKIPLNIQSQTNLDSIVNLSIENNNSNIYTNLTTNSMNILPFGNSMTILEIDTRPNLEQGNYILPIKMNVAFPRDTSFDIGTKNLTLYNSKSATITKNFYIPVNVLPALTWEERINLLVNWLSPINSIWTFITAVGAVLIPFIIRIYSKKSKEPGRNKNNQQYDFSNTSLKGGAPIK
jgi:hypothetical protein